MGLVGAQCNMGWASTVGEGDDQRFPGMLQEASVGRIWPVIHDQGAIGGRVVNLGYRFGRRDSSKALAQPLLQVTLPGPTSEAVEVDFQRAAEVVPLPVPRQTPAPPKPLPEPQPWPSSGIQGPELEIQVTTTLLLQCLQRE